MLQAIMYQDNNLVVTLLIIGNLIEDILLGIVDPRKTTLTRIILRLYASDNGICFLDSVEEEVKEILEQVGKIDNL